MLYDKARFPVYYWEVHWKKPRTYPVDVFITLKGFSVMNPAYNSEDLMHIMKKRRYRYEDEEVIIKRIPLPEKGIRGERPNLHNRFFWDVEVAEIDWYVDYVYVIERVLARGLPNEFDEIVRFYGLDTVLNAFRNQSSFWPEHMEEDARLYFKLEPEELFIHHLRLLNDGWNVWKKNYLGQDDVKDA